MTERLQAPIVEVPVAPSSPAATRATPVPAPGAGWPGVAPSGPGTGTTPGTGTPGGSSVPGPVPAPRPSALPPAPLILPPVIAPHPGPYRQRQRSLADMANEQLRRGKPKDPLEQGMEDAGREDCLRAPTREQAASGLLAAPELALRALSGKCPQ